MGESVSFETEPDTTELESTDAAQQEERSLLEELQDIILATSDMQEFLNELAVLSARSVSHLGEDVLCGITLRRRRRAATVACNSPEAKAMDELQYAYQEGPCLTAAEEQRTIVVSDFQTDGRWPEYAEAVAQHGMRSILSAPFTVGPGANAALNLYSYEKNAFDHGAVTFAQSYARQASKGLQLALRMAQYSEEAQNRGRAMESRTDIDVAVGIVMAQNRCSQEEAFSILQRASTTRNVKLRVLAAEMVEKISGTTPETHFEE